MNSHNQSDDVFDRSLHRSLKNWVDRKDTPVDARSRLLVAAQQESSLPQRKSLKLNFRWPFSFESNQEVLNMRPIYGYAIENVYSLKANMAIL